MVDFSVKNSEHNKKKSTYYGLKSKQVIYWKNAAILEHGNLIKNAAPEKIRPTIAKAEAAVNGYD
jgi:hypothetical protein